MVSWRVLTLTAGRFPFWATGLLEMTFSMSWERSEPDLRTMSGTPSCEKFRGFAWRLYFSACAGAGEGADSVPSSSLASCSSAAWFSSR